MKKKSLSLALALALGLSLLGGCTNDPAPSPTPGVVSPAPSSPQPSPSEPESYTYADTIAWDGQYDVVVIGFGGAGAVASAAAADEGASVLLVEKAPEGEEGGNTRFCGQFFVYGNEDEEATYNYYQAMAAGHSIPEAMLRVYTKNVAHMCDLIQDLTGVPKEQYVNWTPFLPAFTSPEYPEFPGSDAISLNTVEFIPSNGHLWRLMRKNVTDRPDKIDVWFASPATHLIQDPESKTILGVQVERDGKTQNIRAVNGVVLACGGFENSPEMLADYLGITTSHPLGTLYNTGDGIRMAQEVGADLWHMEAYESIGGLGGTCIAVPEGERGTSNSTTAFTSGACIMISGDGTRMLREDEGTRHGHIKQGDVWANIRQPKKAYVICTTEHYESTGIAETYADRSIHVAQAASIAELAEMIQVDPDTLADTVTRFNGYASAGYDPQFGRSAASMAPITGSSYTALEIHAAILNTQGGPRRNENAEIIGLDGSPIPHLYSAGELGGITAFQYQGGSNMAECVIFGQIAGKNASAKKDELPVYQARQKVTSPLTYTPGKASDLVLGAPDVTLAEGEYLGVSHNGLGGDLYVKVTMDGDKIAKVEVVSHKETEGIGTKAIHALPDAIAVAGSTQVDNVSGASMTSRAIKEAVEDALAQAK